jgi:small subunit ribosomal protein S8
MQDPINDMFNRIKNAQAVFHQSVEIPFSKNKYEIAKILEKEGFIGKVEKKGKDVGKVILVDLKYAKTPYAENKNHGLKPLISGIKRISKSGQRIYTKRRNIKTVRGGYGMAVLSTPKGFMADKEARKQNLGGELICEIW